MSKPTFTLAPWQPGNLAAILDADGQPVGLMMRRYGWHDLAVELPEGGSIIWAGGKTTTKTLKTFAAVYTGLRGAKGEQMAAYYRTQAGAPLPS